ncbi:MAG: hypothetical protein IKA22_02205 [Lentisphaeria bacterium]|nr:hypothetical protein [Lentisphaeria bacterium]
MNSNINPQSIQQTGIVISLSREIESTMTKLGANAAGLHDKTDFLAPKLTPECVKLLHYIAAVRNSNAHETTSMTQDELELFVQSCESVLKELEKLSDNSVNEKKTAPAAEEILQKSDSEDFDHTFLKQIHQTWRILAWIPFVHIFYLAFGILKELKNSALYILLLLFYFSGIILLGTGLSDRIKFFWISGIFIFVMVWIYTLVLRVQDKENKLHLNFCIIPGLNLVYICYMIGKKTPVVHFFIYVILCVLYILGLRMLYMTNGGTTAFVILGISYVGAVTDSLFSRLDSKNQK